VYAAYITLAILFTFVAVTTGFATHSGFSLIHLSDQYAAAHPTPGNSMWNSSGAYMSGILLQGAGIIISVVMLCSKNFSKVTAYAGCWEMPSIWPSTSSTHSPHPSPPIL
jgi:hypothetical protein